MRTTLTLEPDVAAELKRLRRESGRPWKAIVNEVLRAGLERENGGRQHRPYKFQTFNLGEQLIPIDDVWGAIAIAEGDDYR